MKRILSVLSLVASWLVCFSQTPSDNIVEHITANGNNIIIQPDSIMKFLIRQELDSLQSSKEAQKPKTTNVGYRVQIFSDNNAKTAKNEARLKSRNVGNLFPQYRTYVTYKSPYWRVKVGDFKTREEAESAKEEISKALPSIQREIRVVRDRINPSLTSH